MTPILDQPSMSFVGTFHAMQQYLVRNPQGCCFVASFTDDASAVVYRDGVAMLWGMEVPFCGLRDFA